MDWFDIFRLVIVVLWLVLSVIDVILSIRLYRLKNKSKRTLEGCEVVLAQLEELRQRWLKKCEYQTIPPDELEFEEENNEHELHS